MTALIRDVTREKLNFEGKPVLPEVLTLADFLTGSYGEYIFKEAQDLAGTKYRNAAPLSVGVYNGGIVQGSNSFYAVLVNEVLRQDSSQKLRTATPADIERTLRAGDILNIRRKYYVDLALVLRSKRDSYGQNNSLSKDLYSQLIYRLGRELILPVMIPLCSLDLKLDQNSYGLGFVLRADADIIHAPVLNKPGSFHSEDINPETGLPEKTGKEGSRTLYTRKGGLSRLDLSNGLKLDADWGNLDNSVVAGRVVVCREATAKNFKVTIK